MKGKTCESCGMPMLRMEDFAAKNPRARYCKYCTTPEGMLQTPEERKRRLTEFIMEDERIGVEEAQQKAVEQMRKMPAWKGKV